MSYEKELLFAKQLAKQAGELTKANFGLKTKAVWKADNTPLTETDTAINKLVIESVQKEFLEDGVLGEEDSYKPECQRIWVVDPVDGTQPFTLGAPLSTFCLSLVISGKVVLGIVYDPYVDRMFWAVDGGGAFMNDMRLQVSDATTLAQGFVIVSSRMGPPGKTVGELVDAVIKRNGKPFNFRSIAYGLNFVASGNAVAGMCGTMHPWDIAANLVILKEAGATVTDFDGLPIERYDQVDNGFLATNGHVHDELLILIRP